MRILSQTAMGRGRQGHFDQRTGARLRPGGKSERVIDPARLFICFPLVRKQSPRTAAGSVDRRCGYSLVEMLVVISMMTTVISLGGMAFYLLLRTDKAVLDGFVTERTIARLALLFRDDVHRADKRIVEPETEHSPLQLSLVTNETVPVRYRVTKEGLVRLTLEQGQVVARDDFVLRDCRISFATGEADEPQRLSLVIHRPSASVMRRQHEATPLRRLRIDAYLRPQNRKGVAATTDMPTVADAVDAESGSTEMPEVNE